MAAEFNSNFTFPCDVANDLIFNALFEQFEGLLATSFDILIHSVAFAPADQISGDFVDSVNREGFQIAHDISAYSLIGLAKAALP